MYRMLFSVKVLFAALLLCLPIASQAQETVFFVEDFDTVTPPDLPAGWADATGEWESSSSVASTGSGINNIKISGTVGAAVQSASADLSGMTTGTLEYLVRRTSSYEQDSLTVFASTNGGISFPVLLLNKGEALPVTDGTYELITVDLPPELLGLSDVIFQFIALGGSTSGSNVRIDDVTVRGSGEPASTTSTFGFAAATSSVDPNSGLFEVPVFIDFTNDEGLHGVQFEMSWATGDFELVDVIRGSAISSTAWQINFDSREGELRVVLLGDQASALSTGLYDPLMTLQFTVNAGNTAEESTLSLDRVLGALSVRTGDDAGLIRGLSVHTVSLAVGSPSFSADLASLDAGTVGIDNQVSANVTVTNTGDADLLITAVTSSNSLFDVDVTETTIGPGASQPFAVTFSPLFENFGYQAGELTFTHNAEGGSDVINLSGIGTGGRGDMSEDGLVDAMDLVVGIDFVLEVLSPAANQLQSADVFPYEVPDGELDVRDLTVLSQAILLDVWPDDSSLPVPAPTSEAGKFDLNAQVQLEVGRDSDHTYLYLNAQVPIRAFQLDIGQLASQNAWLQTDELQGAGMKTAIHLENQSLKVLGAKYDGNAIPSGRYPLLMLSDIEDMDRLDVKNALAISVDGARLALSLPTHVSTGLTDDVVGDEMFEVLQPYPNPFVNDDGGDLSIPLSLGNAVHVEAKVFDILGRRVATLAEHNMAAGRHVLQWNGVDEDGGAVAAGLYLVKVDTEKTSHTRVVTIR